MQQVEAAVWDLVFNYLVELSKPLCQDSFFGDALFDQIVHYVFGGQHLYQFLLGRLSNVYHDDFDQVIRVFGFEEGYFLVDELQNHLKKHNSRTPDVNFGVVKAVAHQKFWCSERPSADVVQRLGALIVRVAYQFLRTA